jgi:hypothetical protein
LLRRFNCGVHIDNVMGISVHSETWHDCVDDILSQQISLSPDESMQRLPRTGQNSALSGTPLKMATEARLRLHATFDTFARHCADRKFF